MAQITNMVNLDDEIEDLDEANEVISSSYTITAYGADYPVDSLVKRLSQGDIVVPLFSMPVEDGLSAVGYQREFVWKKPQCDRFIESLLLGLPVPGIFLVKESNGKHLVLDGQQRLRTLQYFYDGLIKGKEFTLENVQEKWQGKTYKTLDVDDRRRLDDSIIHATVVRQDEPSEDQSSVYLIFERLNSGGTYLHPQEIRVALYHGRFATFLNELNSNESWRILYGKKSPRLKDLELILRFFALFYKSSSYKRPMKEFLNRYMASNANLQENYDHDLRKLFESTVETINSIFGERAFRLKSTVNAAIADSLMVGVATRLVSGSINDVIACKTAYSILLADDQYLKAVTSSTADEESVRLRLQRAVSAFANIK